MKKKNYDPNNPFKSEHMQVQKNFAYVLKRAFERGVKNHALIVNLRFENAVEPKKKVQKFYEDYFHARELQRTAEQSTGGLTPELCMHMKQAYKNLNDSHIALYYQGEPPKQNPAHKRFDRAQEQSTVGY